MSATWYDVLDVEPTAAVDEIRAAWRRAVAELDPTDRRFRVYNQAAEVLLDPDRRAAYDAELAAEAESSRERSAVGGVQCRRRTRECRTVEPKRRRGRLEDTAARRRLWLVPGWALVAMAGLVAAALVVAGRAW